MSSTARSWPWPKCESLRLSKSRSMSWYASDSNNFPPISGLSLVGLQLVLHGCVCFGGPHLLGRFFCPSAGSFEETSPVAYSCAPHYFFHPTPENWWCILLSLASRFSSSPSLSWNALSAWGWHRGLRLCARMTLHPILLLSHRGPCGQQMDAVQVPHVPRVPAGAASFKPFFPKPFP